MKYLISGLLFLGVAIGLTAYSVSADEENNYTNKVVEIKQTELSNGCVLVDLTLETRRGDNTTPVRTHRQFTACNYDVKQ